MKARLYYPATSIVFPCVTILLFLPALAMAKLPPRTNLPGKPLVVVTAPSMWDARYKDRFRDLVQWNIDFVRTLMGRDNVLLLADRHTMRYYRGKLPDDTLLEADIFDIWMRQFAPMTTKDGRLIQFEYAEEGDAMAKQVSLSLKRFIKEHYLEIDTTSSLHIRGSDVVASGDGKAVLPFAVLDRNLDKYQDWAIRIQVFNTFGKSVFLEPFTNTTFHEAGPIDLENLMSFVASNVLAISEMAPPDMERIEKLIAKKFRGEVLTLPIKTHYSQESFKGLKSVCGFHTSLLVTDDFIYMPAFGNDPVNWEIGHSAIMDKLAYRQIQVNTPRKVIPVNVPHRICQLGGTPRTLTWQAKGPAADRLVNLARMRANIRRVKLKALELKAGKPLTKEPTVDFKTQ